MKNPLIFPTLAFNHAAAQNQPNHRIALPQWSIQLLWVLCITLTSLMAASMLALAGLALWVSPQAAGMVVSMKLFLCILLCGFGVVLVWWMHTILSTPSVHEAHKL